MEKTGKDKYCNCLYYSANALARMLTKMAEDSFGRTGLAPSYGFLLMSVNDKPGIQPKELSEHMQLTPSTVTRLLEKLEYKGLVERSAVGRATEVRPTSDGVKLQPLLRESWQNLYKEYSNLLGEDQAKKLTKEIHEASQLMQ
ncbi:MarR family transcriptional regulator [Fulvivirga sp. RKSG066]|uniref:MarR family winged helix-turn-helix transcriptional regulator n=1 Tax=Fulvivirga aurantia TaxID=2529383 RepID=UPI0012BC82C8|nr:MarR family transcriptional regulator [Fulvivirga aurantia]MTI21609.1 MarR family transcriptional regulator [Fulvivirga aurantia]